jgi:hypothetical protein
MNWRRGLLLALIHFALASALIGWDVSKEWNLQHAGAIPAPAHMVLTAWQEEGTVQFDPCHGGFVDQYVTPQQRTVQMANVPVWVLTGWENPCPASWTLTGMIHFHSPAATLRNYLLVSVCLCALVPIQWLVIGAFPLVRARRWYVEPAAMITICALVSIFLILLNGMLPVSAPLRFLSPLLEAFAILVWLYWFGLLIWKSLLTGWRFSMQRTAHNT